MTTLSERIGQIYLLVPNFRHKSEQCGKYGSSKMAHFEKTFRKIVDFNLTGDIKKSHWTNSETKFRARPENDSFRGLKRNLHWQNAQKRHFWAYLGLNLVLSQKPLTRIFLNFPPRKL